MEAPDVIDKIHELSDLELATLLCLIAKEHCIISTDSDGLDDLEQELQLVSDMFSPTFIHDANSMTRLSPVFLAFRQL